MPEEKITLDKKTFRALSVDTRVKIVKSLLARRKTLSELKDELGMSPSTVKEHLDTLINAGLVKRIDDKHKWKYYEITKKGEKIVGSKETKVWIILALAAIATVGLVYNLLMTTSSVARIARTAEEVRGIGDTLGAETTAGSQWPCIILIVALIIALVAAAVYLYHKRRG
ncbi:MAG: hypothetical protein B6U68_02685 [Candidatus Aenigmarchaeota archaeon ex4484_14]|nr:MAG: hypothetical protein B6U68_02685 [Candidatus Aenigmarchaeota archaeon ex4484_14]